MVPTATRRRLSREERYTLVLDAALEVFAADGYDRASMDDIAGKSGISKPVLYEHCDSKRELYIAVLAQQVGVLRSGVLPMADPAIGALKEKLALSARAALSFARESPNSWRLLFQEPAGDPEIAEAFRHMRSRATKAVAAVILENGFSPSSGLERTKAANAVAAMLMSAVEALGDIALREPSVELDAFLETYIDLVWVGIRARVSPNS
jgi:AcrR family transcriptional regulator